MPDSPRSTHLTVMISSTALDLPEHRKEVQDACLRQGMFPLMMEHLPANDRDAIAESLRLVDEANIYLGIFAYRYGYIPQGYKISITEMEYNRAFERGIPRLIFLMHEGHPLIMAEVDRGESALKIDTFRARLQTEQVVNFFTSPADLRALAINSLSYYRQPNLRAFHYVSDIPLTPEPYIAHPYTLLQTSTLIGRQAELNLLTDWVANPKTEVYPACLLSIVAIGGMGKSALTWKWFRDIAPIKMQPLAGRMWWSFYESDATFENFVIRALAYTTGRAKEEIGQLPSFEREAQLLAVLDREPYLIVLDGLERILIAYAHMDAARLADDDLDQQTANVVTGALGLPQSASQSFIGEHRLRKTTDPRHGTFLRKLATVRAARVLISTRLYPADLQTSVGSEKPGSKAIFLGGLADDDALSLWYAFGVSGSRESMLSLLQTFDKHPLLIQLLAGEVAHDRRAPGDFDRWWKAHPDFNPFKLPLVQVKSHILAFAFQGLDGISLKVLRAIAVFHMPATYDMLVALLVGSGKPCKDESMLIAVLSDLEDRGLLGWDRRANRYDLHPIVRGVIWSGLEDQEKQNIFSTMRSHFEAIPTVDPKNITRLEDLTFTIELFSSLIGLRHYEEAITLYRDHLNSSLRYFGAYDQVIKLLEMFFPLGQETLPPLDSVRDQSLVLNLLSLAYGSTGQLGKEIVLLRHLIALLGEDVNGVPGSIADHAIDLQNLAVVLHSSGALCEAEYNARSSLLPAKHYTMVELSFYAGMSLIGRTIIANGLNKLELVLATRGMMEEADNVNQASLELYKEQIEELYKEQIKDPSIGPDANILIQRALWKNDPVELRSLLARVLSVTYTEEREVYSTLALRLGGIVAMNDADFETADQYLSAALERARTVHLVEEEFQTLLWLAELRRKQKAFQAAREFLEDLWNLAERGPYVLIQADARNILAQIERDIDNQAAAAEAATTAYHLAWCDGPPFAFYWGLQAAKAHLSALGAPEPHLPSFDASKYKPMPKVYGIGIET